MTITRKSTLAPSFLVAPEAHASIILPRKHSKRQASQRMTTTRMTKMAWNIKCLTLNYFNIVIAFPMVFVIYCERGVCNIGCQRYSHRFVSNQSCILAWHFVRMSEFYLSSHVTALQSRASGSQSTASILDDFIVNIRKLIAPNICVHQSSAKGVIGFYNVNQVFSITAC